MDDFFQFKNARKIIDVAIENGAKLTLFPIGKNVLREELQDTLRYAHENGMEIENHTLEHKRHFQMDDATFERQIYLQCLCVDKVLGVDYQEHLCGPSAATAGTISGCINTPSRSAWWASRTGTSPAAAPGCKS